MKEKTIYKLLILAIVLLTVLIGVGLWYIIFVDNIAKEVTAEIGTTITADGFKVRSNSVSASFETDISTLDLSVPGEHTVYINYYGRTCKSTLKLVDTVLPEVTTQNVTRFSNQPLTAQDFVASVQDETEVTVEYVTEPNMTLAEEQEVSFKVTDLGGNTALCSAKLKLIFDEQAPEITGVTDKIVYVGVPVDFLEAVTVKDDLDPEPIISVDESKLDPSVPGTYTLTYIARDANGNQTAETVSVTVIEDTVGPEILGVTDLSIYQGSTVSYRRSVVLKDDYDEAPALQIDSSKVDLATPGTYEVTYTATDAAGNKTVLTTTITVKEQSANYVEESVIYAKADELLARIVTDGMTPQEQVKAVCTWVKTNCRYSNRSDKTDRLQGAYLMMTNRIGDCFNYSAICTVFFERLGIPFIHVQRSADSNWPGTHYWVLASIDGGENYYHVDVCPASRFYTFLCLVTDEELASYDRQAPGYYMMDEGVYPATPEESPW